MAWSTVCEGIFFLLLVQQAVFLIAKIFHTASSPEERLWLKIDGSPRDRDRERIRFLLFIQPRDFDFFLWPKFEPWMNIDSFLIFFSMVIAGESLTVCRVRRMVVPAGGATRWPSSGCWSCGPTSWTTRGPTTGVVTSHVMAMTLLVPETPETDECRYREGDQRREYRFFGQQTNHEISKRWEDSDLQFGQSQQGHDCFHQLLLSTSYKLWKKQICTFEKMQLFLFSFLRPSNFCKRKIQSSFSLN